MADVLAFADEYGQPNLDTSIDNVSTHYIVAGVIVEHGREDAQRAALDAVRGRHFQTGVMRSASIGSSDNRRLRILSDLCRAGVHALALIVDKDLIREDSGLRFQRPFRRFLNRKLYEELYNTFPSLHLTADRVGKSDFMIRFKAFLEETHHLNTLFSDSAMEWGVGREEVFLQAADVICGSLGRCFDRKKLSPRASEIKEAMTRWVQLRDGFWREATQAAAVGTADVFVSSVANQRAETFIERNRASKDEDVRRQLSCLKYLLFHKRHIDAEAYVHAPEIIGSTEVPRVMTKRQFQTHVIARLRDADVLIASDSRGYKVPSTMDDVLEYLRWTKKQVEPMVARAKRMAEAIQLASNNTLRLLEEDEFKYLRGPSS
ncbi:MAG TPA: DUF3800 domain-containing protein [Thermoguttaceae bacterium]|nr:DUF3800 domain-containing protein [Thermoguttaceae bacterium]